MPESGTYGSVRGALSNGRPYRDRGVAALLTMWVRNLILRSIAKRCVSKDEAAARYDNLPRFMPAAARP
jgi:hypothetical protein